MSEPEVGNHNNLWEIGVHAEEVFVTLEDAGFDFDDFRLVCAKRGQCVLQSKKGRYGQGETF